MFCIVFFFFVCFHVNLITLWEIMFVGVGSPFAIKGFLWCVATQKVFGCGPNSMRRCFVELVCG